MKDTIASIATALGIGSISIIRVSGTDSISIVNQIFKGKDLKQVDTHTIHYGFIMDEEEKIDEVLVTIMKAPRSFTTEDVVEINCHGGISATTKILETLLSHGCRLAEPGEFTKRAFLNGRIDLLEAEGVMDIIEAKTDKNRKLALAQVSGKVSNMIHSLREDIASVLAHIAVNIDYPEYEDIEIVGKEELLPSLQKIQNRMHEILKESRSAKIIKEGILTAIVGRPNVGKSSLLNLLLEEEKAIVTDIPGTTRDIVEGSINIDGLLLNIMDTAGIRKTEDKVESIGVEKSFAWIDKAELTLFVLNYNEPITEEDLQIYDKIKNKNYIILINKTDLEKKIDISIFEKEKVIYMSAIKEEGIEALKKEILKMYALEKIETEDPTYLTNARSIALLRNALGNIEDAIDAIETGVPIDMAEVDIRTSWNTLGEITGEVYTDELVDAIFSRFCLGK